jgi:hypothetical protein
MHVSKPSSQPITMLDTPLEIHVNDVRNAGVFSPSAILDQIKAERDRLEQLTHSRSMFPLHPTPGEDRRKEKITLSRIAKQVAEFLKKEEGPTAVETPSCWR